ncbi:hypothetical protein NL533_30815, partial [Klebsiella pneumoniae]|nr:hypothetical protein [Klebsiella pneumoniae]
MGSYATPELSVVSKVRHQPTRLDVLSLQKHRRQSLVCGKSSRICAERKSLTSQPDDCLSVPQDCFS